MTRESASSNRQWTRRSGRPLNGTTLFWELIEDGPFSVQETPDSPTMNERRLYDVRTFNPLSTTTSVLYLGQYHDPETVLRHFFEVNQELLRDTDVTARGVTYALTEPHLSVWHEIRDEELFDVVENTLAGGTGGEKVPDKGTTCPECGKEDVKNLPRHMRVRCPGPDGGAESADTS